MLQPRAAVLSIIAMGVDRGYTFLKSSQSKLLQDRRDGFRLNENPVIFEKHFRKHDIIKGVGKMRCKLRKGMISVLEFMYCRFYGTE